MASSHADRSKRYGQVDMDRLLQHIRSEYSKAVPPGHSPWKSPVPASPKSPMRVIYNSPAPSVCSSRRTSSRGSRQSSRGSSFCSNPYRRQSSTVSAIVVIPDGNQRSKLFIQVEEEEEGEEERDNTSIRSFGTAQSSSIASVSCRSSTGAARRITRVSMSIHQFSISNRSPLSCWFDDETDNDTDLEAQQNVPQELTLAVSRNRDDLKLFDPNFSFDRRCVTSPVEEKAPSPLQDDVWFSFTF